MAFPRSQAVVQVVELCDEMLRVSLNDFALKAAALAFREIPEANATSGETTVTRHDTGDISVGVADAADAAERARSGRPVGTLSYERYIRVVTLL